MSEAVDRAERPAFGVPQFGGLAGRELGQGRTPDVHLVAENPEVTGPDAPVLVFFEKKRAHAVSLPSFQGGSKDIGEHADADAYTACERRRQDGAFPRFHIARKNKMSYL